MLKCGKIYKSKLHGYDVRKYTLTTSDGYKLELHRLVHPSELLARKLGKRVEKKKPYLLLHGLLGSSASFLAGAPPEQVAPGATMDLNGHIGRILEARQREFVHTFSSCADQFRGAHQADKPDKWARKQQRKFAHSLELDFDSDPNVFASAYRQAHRKVHFPLDAFKLVSNSLAFTLANFNYDVWLMNSRGNYYSRTTNRRFSAANPEYWNFRIETLVREDLLAAIDLIKRVNECSEPIGLVSYSYSSMQVLNLLSKFPAQLEAVQPVIMLAPTLLTANSNPDKVRRTLLRSVSKVLLAKNGPFPSLGRQTGSSGGGPMERLESTIEQLLCKLPIFSKFCHLFETVLLGRSKKITTVKGLLSSDQQELRRENECGQTSLAIMHQIINNLQEVTVLPQFSPQENINRGLISRQKLPRRSVILVHSLGDEISTPAEVEMLRKRALRDLTLVDYFIEQAKFQHTDFLFAQNNQFLVNAEVVRMAAIYDFLLYHPRARALPLQLHDGPLAARAKPPPAP